MQHKTLEQRTLQFWRLSKKWNGQMPGSKPVKTSTVLKQLNGITDVTFYERPLKERARLLSDDIIRGGKGRKATSEPSPISQLERTNP